MVHVFYFVLYNSGMKIGEFAKKFHINNSTVRYYIKNGLLNPGQKNEQFVFDDECLSDMEQIIKYKRYRFTISEMQLLFFLEKTSRFNDKLVNELCLDILRSKKEELLKEIKELNSDISDLDEEIKTFPKVSAMTEKKAGVPYSAIPLLYCPKCNLPLQLNAATIAKGMIRNGHLSCECDYDANINEGIIICRDHEADSPLKAFNNIESVISAKDEFSPLFRKLYHNAYLYMTGRILGHSEEPMTILYGPFTYNHILESIEKLGKQNTYIVVDPSRKRIEKIKQYLAAEDYKIIYIVGKSEDIPLKNSSVDVFVDDYSTSNQIFSYNTFNAERIASHLKTKGLVTGLFTSYHQAPTSLAAFTKDHPDFESSKLTMSNLKMLWEDNGILLQDEKSIGYTTASGKHYLRDNPGEPVEVICYASKKAFSMQKS